MGMLVLIRHGQSEWNNQGRFQGWQDPPLTDRGREDVQKCAEVMEDLSFDCAYSSPQQRASTTLDIVLRHLGIDIPIHYADELKERRYGEMEGMTKEEAIEKYGVGQVEKYRNGYAERPPGGECIKDVEERITPYIQKEVLPQVIAGKNVLLVSHRTSLKPVIKLAENLSPEEMQEFVVNLCSPMMYHYEGDQMVKKEFREVPGIIRQSKTAEKVVR